MIGERFGDWAITAEVGHAKRRGRYYVGRHTCGREKLMHGGKWRQIKNQSCICIKTERQRSERANIVGEWFGDWVITSEGDLDNWGSRQWVGIHGPCGREKAFTASLWKLVRNHSCKCRLPKRTWEVGSIFAGLEVMFISEKPTERRDYIMFCKCLDCYNFRSLPSGKWGRTRSCGCLRHHTARLMAELA